MLGKIKNTIGYFYSNGLLVFPQHSEKAFEWFRSAAENDDPDAQYKLYRDDRHGPPRTRATCAEMDKK